MISAVVWYVVGYFFFILYIFRNKMNKKEHIHNCLGIYLLGQKKIRLFIICNGLITFNTKINF